MRTARELVSAHEYAKAAAESERRMKEHPDDTGALHWHGTAMLCLGRLREALEDFRQVDARERAKVKGSDGRILTIGAIQWLLGEREDALKTFESAVRGIQAGSITYGDFAGGVSQGLLLWYGGVTTPSAAARERALEYLRDRAEKPLIKSWPGPLALFAVGTASLEDVLLEACGTRDPEAAMRLARRDVLKRRRLVNATFCFATRRRSEGSEEDCLAQMRMCARIENPIVEVEWYLARGEVEQARAR